MKKTVRYEVQPRSPIKIITYHFTDHAKIWRHWHEYLEIIYLVRGHFTLKADSNVFDVKDGDIIIFNPFEVHESLQLSKENEYYVFIVPPEFIQCRTESESLHFSSVISDNKDCRSILRKAAEYSESEEVDATFLLNSEIFRFLYFAAKEFSTPVVKEAEYVEKNRHMVEDIKSRISYCYAEPINIDLLASAFFVSVSHLQHTFKEQTGMSIIDYINKTRIENSKKLLNETNFHISVIAEKVGIADYNYFSRVFRKYEGISPTQYRKQSQPTHTK